MGFNVIDLENWDRKEYFNHYFNDTPCTYSMTAKLDITEIKNKKMRIYPAMLYYITTAVNKFPQFRMAIKNGKLGMFDDMTPYYTVFHKDTETFSSIWTAYSENYDNFLASYEKDIAEFGDVHKMNAKPNVPENIYTVSMIPWTTFEGFNLNLQKDFDYLIPILLLENIMKKMANSICLSQFKSIILFVMGSIHADL